MRRASGSREAAAQVVRLTGPATKVLDFSRAVTRWLGQPLLDQPIDQSAVLTDFLIQLTGVESLEWFV